MGREAGVDRLAALAVVITIIVSVWYVALIGQQGDRPVAWFLAGLAGSALLVAYGAVRAAPRRRTVLAIAGTVLSLLGLVALASIGFPILVAGLLTVIAAVRAT